MNLKQCRRCGADIKLKKHATVQRFCSRGCYDTWWSEYRTHHVTRGEVARKVWGDKPKVRLNNAEAAWLAALVDGEGTIGIWRERRPKNRSGWRYRAVIQIVNSNKELMERARNVVDGYVHWKNLRRDNPKHKPTYGVTVNRRAVPGVLNQIRDYLVAKRKQSDVVLEFCRVLDAAPMRTSRDHDVFQALYLECRALNKRGV